MTYDILMNPRSIIWYQNLYEDPDLYQDLDHPSGSQNGKMIPIPDPRSLIQSSYRREDTERRSTGPIPENSCSSSTLIPYDKESILFIDLLANVAKNN